MSFPPQNENNWRQRPVSAKPVFPEILGQHLVPFSLYTFTRQSQNRARDHAIKARDSVIISPSTSEDRDFIRREYWGPLPKEPQVAIL